MFEAFSLVTSFVCFSFSSYCNSSGHMIIIKSFWIHFLLNSEQWTLASADVLGGASSKRRGWRQQQPHPSLPRSPPPGLPQVEPGEGKKSIPPHPVPSWPFAFSNKQRTGRKYGPAHKLKIMGARRTERWQNCIVLQFESHHSMFYVHV